MKKLLITFLKLLILLFAIGILAGLIWFPQTEGRAVNLDILSIYTDPFIIYIYIGSIPFFVGLSQVFKLLTLIDTNQIYSHNSVAILRYIKLASLCQIGFIALSIFYIGFFVHGDDNTGPISLGIIMSIVVGTIAIITSIVQKSIHDALHTKSEKELTV